MKAFLMYPDRDFDHAKALPPNAASLTQDLELATLFRASARGDDFLAGVIRQAVLNGLADPEAILYRQRILADCLAHPVVVREMYALTVEALDAEKKIWRAFWNSPDVLLHRSVEVLGLFVGFLKRLRAISDERAHLFQSEGLARLCAMLTDELDDTYVRTIETRLAELRFRRGVMISARLGPGNKGIHHVLRTPPGQRTWKERIFSGNHTDHSFQIADRDEAGFRAVAELRGKGINLVANALAQSSDHILGFFGMLRAELGFYVACMNLHEQLTGQGEPTCVPVPVPAGSVELSAHGLYDPCLALTTGSQVVGNDVHAGRRSTVMITGANQGGKSTFLRSVGIAQLMMQSGMFVAADGFTANVCPQVFTHFRRGEDVSMQSGKLDEELARMSDVADHIGPHCMLLCNESFAATNEREGSEIARQIISALTPAGIRILFVTHLFDLAHGLYTESPRTALFLRAEREADGRRTFRLVEGEPLPTSFGEDSYRRIFGPPEASAEVEIGSARGAGAR
jgi:hypothetical protein